MNWFDTTAGQNTMEAISIQLKRIADALEKLADKDHDEGGTGAK